MTVWHSAAVRVDSRELGRGHSVVAKKNIEDKRCQLCLGADGTLVHRFECPATRPPEGWSTPPEAARHAIIRLGRKRGELMKVHGLAVLRMPSPISSVEGSFRWHGVEPDVTRDDLRWYTDGSATDPSCHEI